MEHSEDEEKSVEKQESNPMVQLFYGHFVAEGTHEGSKAARVVSFVLQCFLVSKIALKKVLFLQ